MKNLKDMQVSVTKEIGVDVGIKDKKPPPVDLWAKQLQAHCGEIDIVIDAQGKWFHEGDPINRQALVKLFASVLWHDKIEGLGQYFLITPAERLQIKVDDAPFIAVLSELVGSQWQVTTNLDEGVVIGEQHRVELRLYKGQWLPYVCIRYDLWARASRVVYEQWINAALDKYGFEDHEQPIALTLTSGDYLFDVAKA